MGQRIVEKKESEEAYMRRFNQKHFGLKNIGQGKGAGEFEPVLQFGGGSFAKEDLSPKVEGVAKVEEPKVEIF